MVVGSACTQEADTILRSWALGISTFTLLGKTSSSDTWSQETHGHGKRNACSQETNTNLISRVDLYRASWLPGISPLEPTWEDIRFPAMGAGNGWSQETDGRGKRIHPGNGHDAQILHGSLYGFLGVWEFPLSTYREKHHTQTHGHRKRMATGNGTHAPRKRTRI